MKLDHHAQVFSEILSNATAAVGAGYIHFQIDGGDAPIYRERVYCYELYHQMRRLWPKGYPYTLSGEVDKRAHPILRQLDAEFHTPDFLVHTPGAMAGNHTIIEVKPARVDADGIRKDIQTLDTFVCQVGYRRAIYLIYGDEAQEALAIRIAEHASDLRCHSPIELWFHAQVGKPATRAAILAPRN